MPSMQLLWLSVLTLSCAAADDAPASSRSAASAVAVARLVSGGSVAPATERDCASDTSHVVGAARAALEEGRPWRATQLLAPIVADSKSRSACAVFIAATAAADWGGWEHVERLLRSEPWLDSRFDGGGRVLLARSILEPKAALPDSVADSLAVPHARLAMKTAPDDAARAMRLVLLARAYERASMADEARQAYMRAAAALPGAGDWLRLRAAALSPDSAARAGAYAALRTGVARDRAPLVEAEARERSGDLQGAARAWAALGAPARALSVRLREAGDATARGEIRRELVALVEVRPGSSEAREATELLDRSFAPLTPREELVIARSAATSGPAAPAAAAFALADRHGLAAAADRYAYGIVLARLGRHREAIGHFARAGAESAPLAAQARYQRARSLLRAGRGSDARAELQKIVRDHPRVDSSASAALFLLGDLASDGGQESTARARFRELARRYPGSPLAARARFRAAIIAFVAGDARMAALELDTLQRIPETEESTAALYWAGRAWEKAGDARTARARWQEVVAGAPGSYYALLASRRIGGAPWSPPAAGGEIARSTAADSAAARGALLERIGLRDEALREYERLERDAETSVERLVETASVFHAHTLESRGIRLGIRALSRGAPASTALYRIIYPFAFREVVTSESRRHGLDEGFVAALIRQESNFTPWATSRAGARGLMQVMPAVGRQAAVARRFPVWDDALLYQPEVNVQLGTAHLAAMMTKYRELVRVLAAYNAGGSRVDRWVRKPGASDPELFVENIPYVETRDYVRIVLRNREWYRALYGL